MITIIWRSRTLSELLSSSRKNFLRDELEESSTAVVVAETGTILVDVRGAFSFEPVASMSQMPTPKIASRAT
jgi:hypothetical protein